MHNYVLRACYFASVCSFTYNIHEQRSRTTFDIREYGSTLYVGMTREKNGGRIKRVH